jgi:hypothetical protein
MEYRNTRKYLARRSGASPAGRLRRPGWGRSFACLAVMATMTGGAQNTPSPGGSLRFDKIEQPTAINQAPDANAQMAQREKDAAQKNFATANAERRKQISDDSAKLLKLATDLKAEVDKTTKDTLSLGVIRKADEIEKLAHSVKEKMKLTAAN